MNKDIKAELKKKQVEFIIRTTEYKQALKEVAREIQKGSLRADNEASVASVFELELFSFVKEVLGLRYHPEKEKTVNTERHVSKGRIDSKIGALIIEFKHESKLKTETQKKEANKQLIDYLEGVYQKQPSDYLGLITDGTKCKFIRKENGEVSKEAFGKINYKRLERLVNVIVLLDKVALSPENLVKDFCEPKDDNIAKTLTLELYESLKKNPTGRSLMLFNEWKELFRLAHDDKSKQKAIEERKEALSRIARKELKTTEDEYLILYALQTTYAIIIKIIAYKVISKTRFKKSLIDFNVLANADFETLRIKLSNLEEGAIFRSVGIGNLLEGDFFSWYSAKDQWNPRIARKIQEIFNILAKYEDKAVFETGENVEDLFKDLFLKIMPEKVRHSLGEFYTPPWLADNLVSEALKGYKNNWTALDPCAGSGTFLTILIKKVLEETKDQTPNQRLYSILNRVKAIDLNPLAVLTARINYFINICPLVREEDSFEIPVYLGDASNVPESIHIDGVQCLRYKIKTMKEILNIEIPKSAVSDPGLFSKTMTNIENDIRNLDAQSISENLLALIKAQDRKNIIKERIKALAGQFVRLEKKDWNGIWARIVTNFLTTANLGKFDIIVGNPPWIDWKNLPAGYRERIKTICVVRHLFSGDGITGGINLNICALIANVAAQSWLNSKGTLAFLMPQALLFQQSYEGFRHFILDKNRRLYFQKVFDWTKSGHPFAPSQNKFVTFFLSHKVKDYSKGIPLSVYVKKRKYILEQFKHESEFEKVAHIFKIEDKVAGQANKDNTIFSYADDEKELEQFKKISGRSYYIGREGIEFYPQEIFLLEIDEDLPKQKEKIYVKNFQNPKSKYKIPQDTYLLEKKYLYPLVRGVNIKRFHIDSPQYIVPFPYKKENPRSPIQIKELYKESKLLAQYLNQFKKTIEAQTDYNSKIIGTKYYKEFYALARVGKYSFAKYYVAFRDNTKWQAAVVSGIGSEWGGWKRPVFQNHAVSISETEKGRFISLEEAHYICAILNAPITAKFLLNSSDSRSFKIRPPINIPEYNPKKDVHRRLSFLSRKAHENYDDNEIIEAIDRELDALYLKL